MPMVTSERMLLDAQKGRYAVGAFNVENMEMAQAVIRAAEALRAPVILQTTPGTLKYAPPELFFGIVSALAASASVPVALHLDHGASFEMASRAFHAGYPSIMIDGSKLPLDENIALTRRVCEMCAPCGIPVEGELGKVGGKEDDMADAGTGYTDPDEAERFVRETGVSSLAVGVGTAHGVYKTAPVLNVELISALYPRVGVPMVLHGASGLEDDVVRECVSRGICKVNVATELRIAYTQATRELLYKDEAVIDPKKFGEAGRKAVQARVEEKMRVFGCADRA